ncbi:hypothetical protein [Bradyrhizobium sp. LHD-71]|uniref:hypothetical protein n=1 Tax=Bradyrhizobium sp. LHD-71 TaxID=3072141 RepID=UPI0028102036|nr:hypothetical protein [Bradyrhizobium sp. LHD-71]MDQ8727152.1 hypothetical protein [Bradyrhizobium sp. LHD-71]
MAKHSRSKAATGTVASEVIACIAAHTDLPQADFSAKRKIKRYAAGGKRRGALIRALLAWPALKRLGLRQRHFNKAGLSGKSTIDDIVEVIAAVAQTAKRPSVKKRAVKKGARTGTTRRPVKARRKAKTSAPSKTKAGEKAKRAAASKTSKSKTSSRPAKSKTSNNKTLKNKPRRAKTPKKVAAKSKLPQAQSKSPKKKAARKAAPRRVETAPKTTAGNEAAPKRTDAPRMKRTPRAVRMSREAVAELKVQHTEHDVRAEPPGRAFVESSSFQADAIDDAVSSAMSGPDEESFESNARPDRPADHAAETPRPRHAKASLHDADQDG